MVGGQNIGNNPLPAITKDIYVKNIKGKMEVNKDGLVESILGIGTLSAKDANGTVYEFTADALAKLSDINTTVVQKPDLTGKTVQKQRNGPNQTLSNPETYIGKYKKEILIQKDNKFVKIGESFVDITHIDKTTIVGRYYDVFKEGFEGFEKNKKDFSFEGKFDMDSFNASFNYKDLNGNEVNSNLYIDQMNSRITLGFETSPYGAISNDNTFNLVLE